MRRGSLFWGIALLLFGALMLAGELGVRLPTGASPASLFLPLLLLFVGGWIIYGAFHRGKVEVREASIGLQGASAAKVKLDHGAGELKIHGGAAGGDLMRGTFAGGLESKTSRSGETLNVQMRSAYDMSFLIGARPQLDWDVAFNADVPIALDLNLGANKSIVDLRDMNLTHLDLDTGASDTEVYLPARGRYAADIDCGAASLTVRIPEGLAARIRATVVAGEARIDSARFPRSGEYYQSPDYDSAPNAVDMTIDAGAASIRVL